MTPDIKEDIFVAIWILLILFGYLWERNATPLQKKKNTPIFAIIGGGIFIFGINWIEDLGNFKYFASLMVVVIILVNLKLTRICSECGKIQPPISITPPKYCSKCGSKYS